MKKNQAKREREKIQFHCDGCDRDWDDYQGSKYAVHTENDWEECWICDDCFHDGGYFECDICDRARHMEIDGFFDVDKMRQEKRQDEEKWFGVAKLDEFSEICGSCYQEWINKNINW